MTKPPSPRPPASEPPPTPSESLAGVTQRLRQLRLAEPDASARERVWRRIRPHVDTSASAVVVERLKSLSPPNPSPAVSDRVWGRLQAQLREDKRAGVAPGVAQPRRRGAGRLHPAVGIAALVLVIALTTVTSVAQAALPGTALYPVKRGWEDVQWTLTLTPDARAHLALGLAGRRQAEAESLVAQGRDPALVAQVLAEALSNLHYAAAYLPAADIAPLVNEWQAGVSQWPAAYQAPAAEQLDGLLTSQPLPGATTLPTGLAPATATPAPTLTPPALTAPPTSVPSVIATAVPPSPLAPTSSASPTRVAPSPTPSAPGIGSPTATPLPTLVVPTLPPPTPALPTLAVPTLPPLLPTATLTPPGAPSPTPLLGLPLP